MVFAAGTRVIVVVVVVEVCGEAWIVARPAWLAVIATWLVQGDSQFTHPSVLA